VIWPKPEDRNSAIQAEHALGIARKLLAEGYPTYLVGGIVRDALLGIPTCDVDICTSAPSDVIQRYLPTAKPYGPERYCVFRIKTDLGEIEIAHFRTEHSCDGRHCDVELIDDLDRDLLRRDFTVNALALIPDSLEIIDRVGGTADLAAGILRAIREPIARFREDRLRILRAVRFAAKLDFRIEKNTELAIIQEASGVKSLSSFRIRDEIESMLIGRNPGRAIEFLCELGIWPHIFNEARDNCNSPYWRKKTSAIDRAARELLSAKHRWALLFMPDLSGEIEDFHSVEKMVGTLGFPKSEAKELVTLCRLTISASKFANLDRTAKIEVADSGLLPVVQKFLYLLCPEADFETHLIRCFPNLGCPQLLSGDALGKILSRVNGETIGDALAKLRWAELTGTVNSTGAAETFLIALLAQKTGLS